MKHSSILLHALALGLLSCGQSDNSEGEAAKHSPPPDMPAATQASAAKPPAPLVSDTAAMENPTLVIDYAVSKGWSARDRHAYRIVVTGNRVSFSFHSQQSDSHRKVNYEEKATLSPAEVREINLLLGKADIRQKKEGIPIPDASAHKLEVLRLKYGSQELAGGMFSYVIYESGTAEEEISRRQAVTRKETATLSGNYDLLIENLEKRFTKLDSLETVAAGPNAM